MTSRRTALVTGATSGIGQSICRRLATEGLFVYAHVRDERRAATELKDLLKDGRAQLVVADLLEDGAAEQVMSAASDGNLELLVNNAGGTLEEQAFVPGEVHEAERIYKLNVFTAYELSVLAAERMTEGSIVNITSVNGRIPMVGSRIPLYSSAKAAVGHLTQMLAVRLAPAVRVNAVAPGRTRTEAWGTPEPERERAILADTLINRWVHADEIADATWFLHANRACTGVELAVDGGIGLKAVVTNV